jgi:tetratricopeptide (TPR) repeat protein
LFVIGWASHPYAIIGRAEASEKNGQFDKAELDFVAATEVNALPGDRVSAFSALLDFYHRSRQVDKLTQSLERLKASAERLLAEQTAEGGSSDIETLYVIKHLGNVLCHAGAIEDGIPLLKQGLAESRRVLGAESEWTIIFMNDLAVSLNVANQTSEAIALLKEALALSRQISGPEHKKTLIIQTNLGQTTAGAGLFEQALPLLQEAFKKLEQSGQTEHALNAMNKLGFAYGRAEMWEQAIPLLSEALAQHIEFFGPEHDATLEVRLNLVSAHVTRGEYDALPPLLDDEFQFYPPLFVHEESVVSMLSDLGLALIHVNQPHKAIPILEQSLAGKRRRHGLEHENTLAGMVNLGISHMLAGQFTEGVSLLEESYERLSRTLGPDHHATLTAFKALHRAYRDSGQLDQEKKMALSWVGFVRRQSDDIQLASALAAAADVLLKSGDFTEAEPLARECVDIRKSGLADTWSYFNALSLHGGAMLGQGEHEKAEPLLLEAIQGLYQREREIPEESKVYVKSTLERLVALYESTGQNKEAARWRAKLLEPEPQPLTE